ncbi:MULTISPECIES: DNA topoisomerase IB [unclassified Siphonobacter]|uniref:DNA topoisomerase IB n=1 Tax=unclassified Siphonobacter TaxID=2635712 RepID=UPI000CB51679|nr:MULTISPECIES: DNA topoisomerase IB [unclassified Siphonobacter]MDQ1087045.1 DNA topoisomerase-1 [Siphonobacter sp. SORGH_AS_1065]PKK36632.1 DNA topoisomerase I [Siphonobacter sp. SORGH_AS_0500]
MSVVPPLPLKPARRRRTRLWSKDPKRSAKVAGLIYTTDDQPGILRLRHSKSFRYVDADKKPIRDVETLRRIRSLVIPPAWEKVWISPLENGHLQATGYDTKGRKQYRYHPDWNEVRNETKFSRIIQFAELLPKIRQQVQQDLRRPGLPYEKVLALIVQLMEKTSIRIGNEEYKKQNGSYGLTTMQDKHADIEGSKVTFRFKGKKGVYHEISLKDRKLAKLVQRCKDVPGEELFQYIDNDGNHKSVGSGDINAYLKNITGEEFTAKDFRTWRGTLGAFEAFQALGLFDTPTACKKNINRCYDLVAEALGNTRAVSKKYYVHPKIISAYESEKLWKYCDGLDVPVKSADDTTALSPLELKVKELLEASF